MSQVKFTNGSINLLEQSKIARQAAYDCILEAFIALDAENKLLRKLYLDEKIKSELLNQSFQKKKTIH